MARQASKSFIQPVTQRPPERWSVPAPDPDADMPQINAEERLRMIRETAYFLYERRGFLHGHDREDWLEAEARVDRMISRGRTAELIETPEPDLQQSGGRSIVRGEMMKRILRQHPQRDVPKV